MNGSEKTVIVIPARWASRRFPGKALARLWGKPLIEHGWRRAQRVRGVGQVLVATDDERIRRAVEDFGGRAVMTPSGCRTGTDRVAEAVRELSCELVINLQGDEPLVEPLTVERLLAAMREEATLKMASLCCPIRKEEEKTDPNVVKVVLDRQGFALYFSRSPIPFRPRADGPLWRHIGIYAFRKEFLLEFCRLPQTPLEIAESLEQLRALEHGYRIRVLEVESFPPGVDTPDQLDMLNRLPPPADS